MIAEPLAILPLGSMTIHFPRLAHLAASAAIAVSSSFVMHDPTLPTD